MSTMPDLKKVEVNTFRMTFLSDGLLDIYLGLTLIPYIVWIYSDWAGSMILNGMVFILFFPPFLYLKKRIVSPRVGMIKPGPARRRKNKLLVTATILAVLLTVGMVLFTILAGEQASRPVAGIPTVFWAFGIATVSIAIVVAWLIDWPRVIAYGLMVAMTIPLDAMYFLRSGRIPLTVIPMMVMVGTGFFLLRRFLRRYPTPLMSEAA
jgi:peptidoglycan/LPS O-acetylase OafA/YrhL